MTITVSEEDSLLFEQNGYSYDDVNSTVQHYREIGLSDDEIQNKINLRLNEFKTVPQNKRALENNTNELSYDDPYVQTQDYQTKQLANLLFTPEEYNNVKQKGNIGWWEYTTKFVSPKEWVPGGAVKQGADAGRLLLISNKLEKGEDVSDSDKEFMYNELKKYVEISTRQMSWGAKAAQVLYPMPAFCIEFAVSGGLGKAAATAAIKASGATATKAAIKAGSAIAASKIGAMALGRKATEKAGMRYSLDVSAKIVGGTAVREATLVPAQAYAHYGEQRIADGLNITDKGEVIFREQKDGQLKTALASLGIAQIDITSESMGGIITGAAGAIGRKVTSSAAARGISSVSASVYNMLPKSTRIKLEAAAKVAGGVVSEKARAMGFHGVFGEMAEERAADVLKVAFDLDGEQGYSADQWLSAFYPGAEELLLEAGVFAIPGALSFASRTLYKHLRQKGFSDKEVQNTLNNLSEIEKENMVNDILGDVKVNEDITDEEVDKEAERIETKMENETENGNNIFADFIGKLTGKKKKSSYKTYITGADGEKIEVVYNPALQGETPVIEITQPKLKNISNKTSETKKQISQAVLGENTSIQIKNSFNSKIVNLFKKSLGKMISTAMKEVSSTSKAQKLTAEQKQNLYNDSKEIIANAAELFQKAIPILKHKDVKGTNTEISRYALPVKVNGRNYNVMFTVKNKDVEDIGILYDLKTKDGTASILLTNNSQSIDSTGNSITDNAENFKGDEETSAEIGVNEGVNEDTRSGNEQDADAGADTEIASGQRSDNAPRKDGVGSQRRNGTGDVDGGAGSVDINNLVEFVNDCLKKYNLSTEFDEGETAADKIIKGTSWFGKFYTEWVNRLEPVEALEEKAGKRTKLSPMQRPNLLARLYSGLVGAVRQQIEKNTFTYNKEGNIEITGEGFLPILNDFDKSFADVEKNQDTRHTDLKNYLEAQRFLLDLEKRENFETTEEQKLDAVKTMADLTAKYGGRLNDFEKFSDRIYQFQQRILHNLVDSGNMSEESYKKILKDNPHYIPFQRVMDEQFPSVVTPRSKFSGAKANIKGIKGSEREIKDPFESILRNTYDILDKAYRNRVAQAVANLQEVLPEYIEKRKPVYEVGTAKVKVAYDSKLRTKLEKAIKFFGGKLEYKKSLGKGKGLLLGSYSPIENTIRKRLGSQDRTLAHEFGHMLDFVFGVKDVITQNKTIMQEISKLAEERFSSVVTLENTAKGVEFVETKEEQSQKYIDYVKSDREMIANMFDLYFTSRDYMKKTAPTAYEFIETLSTEYKFLKDIKPSAETGIEEIEQEVWMPSKAKPYGNVIEYWENGKRKFVEVTKPVMEAINDLSMPELNFVEKLFTASARVLRTGATIMPDFWVRNILRDQPIAFIQTRNTRPFVDMVKGLCSLIKKDETYQEWMSSGGSFNSYMDLGDKSIQQAMKDLVNPQGKLMQYLKSFGLKAIEDMSMAFEQATRIGIYAREKLNSPALVSAYEAREGTLDFGRAGKAGRRVNRYIPFFNASIQGVDKIVRTFQEHPVITSVKCLTAVTLPSVLLTGYYLYAAPDDDRKEYLDIPQWQRDIFWCFKSGDNWWRIPKPFEIGYVFGSMPERFVTWAYEKELPDGKELWETVGGFFNAVSPITDVGGFFPPILRTTFECLANYNAYTGKSLYPHYLDELEPAERKNKYTSETAKLIGQKLGVSPAKIDHAISGTIGSSSRYVTDAGDYIINKVREYNGEDINEKPSSLNDIPVLRSFVLREPQGFQTKSVNDFFDIYKKTKEIHNTYKKKTGEERRNYYEKNKLQIKAFNRMDNYYKEIKGLSKRVDKIYVNKNLTGDEKAERIKPLASKISAAAFEANIWYKEYKEQEK